MADLLGGYSVNPDTGDVYSGGASSGNDVWGTIKSGLSTLTDAFVKVKTAQYAAPRTMAAPSGVPSSNVANPFPGTQGAYPQAEAKPAPGGAGLFSGASGLSGILLVVVAAIVLLALARR